MQNKKITPSRDFFVEFLKHAKELGTPFQSSTHLADAVAREIKGNRIIELGAGNGNVTRGILALHPKALVTAFEINSKLLKNLSIIKSSRLKIIKNSAENFSDYVSDFDCVVSGLPLTSMPEEAVDKILECAKKARFIQYKYFPERKLLERYFKSVRGKIVWGNFPPAIVYVCDNNA